MKNVAMFKVRTNERKESNYNSLQHIIPPERTELLYQCCRDLRTRRVESANRYPLFGGGFQTKGVREYRDSSQSGHFEVLGKR